MANNVDIVRTYVIHELVQFGNGVYIESLTLSLSLIYVGKGAECLSK